MRYRLRTLLILQAVGPPLLAGYIWLCIAARESALAGKRNIERAQAEFEAAAAEK